MTTSQTAPPPPHLNALAKIWREIKRPFRRKKRTQHGAEFAFVPTEGLKHHISDEFEKFLRDNRCERMDANRYDVFDKSRCDSHLDRYRFACEYTEGKVVLDCASGLGYGADCLHKLGRASKVQGVEINQDAVKYANQCYASDVVSFSCGSIVNLPFDADTFDVFTSFETLEHVEDEKRQFKEIKRVLKPNGLYILSTPNDWASYSVNPFHVRNYNYASLLQSLTDHFDVLKVYCQNSGTIGTKGNHRQPRSIYAANELNCHLAEYFIAVVGHKQ